MASARILVIDDERSILDLVSAYLKEEGYQVLTASDGESGLKAALLERPDVVVLDIMLPGMDGVEVLTRLRRESDVYVIMLTAKAEETDKVVGLSVGADDYLTKPFSPRELVARVRAALRRLQGSMPGAEDRVLQFESMRIDTGSRKVWVRDELVELTATEFDLIEALAENPDRVLTREQLIERIWGHDYYGETRVVDVHLGHLRKKLGEQGLIATVRGVGYRFEGRRG